MRSLLNAWGADVEKTDKFVELVQKYTEFDELSNEMINNFIERIIVYEGDRSTGKREQRVDIYLNFIGNFVPPYMDIPLTPKEITRQKAKAKEDERIRLEKQKVLREKQREKNRKRREKERNSGNYDEILAQRRAKYAENRDAKIAQAIAEGVTPPREYKPQNF